MKNKGFTLIELLAVIVILAIIALIAVPIILNIIGEAKGQSVERSIELYGNAIKNAVADYSLKHPTEEDITFDDIKDSIEYEGSKVECETHEIYSDGNIWLKDCTVNDSPVEYEYGKKIIMPGSYYGWWLVDENLTVGGSLPNELLQNPPEGKEFYLKLDTDGNTVSSAYACFKRKGNEYCLKGYDKEAFEANTEIIKNAFSDKVNTNSCSFSASSSYCYVGSLNVHAYSDGLVDAFDVVSDCRVVSGGTFACVE